MTGIDLIVVAPWLILAVGLATICILLMRGHQTLAFGAAVRRGHGMQAPLHLASIPNSPGPHGR
jgi:hypothetical protein